MRNLLQVVPVAEEKATARADKEVMQAVEKQLVGQPALNDSAISVKSVDKGVVLLAGVAHSYGDYLRALACTYRVDGVHRIVSEVTTPADFREDERMMFFRNTRKAVDAKAAQVRAALQTSPSRPTSRCGCGPRSGCRRPRSASIPTTAW